MKLKEKQIRKKNILFSAYSLEIGGIETALVDLLNYLQSIDKYKITLVLEKKTGELLKQLHSNIKVISYTPSYNKVFGKVINLCKRIKFTIKYKNKFTASFSYATYCKMAMFTAQTASSNSNLWVHSSYLSIFNNNIEEYKKFFDNLNIKKYKNIIFVSEKSKDEFEKIYNKNNLIVCNNIIDRKKILELSQENEEVENIHEILENKKNNTLFLYVGRITEDSKKVSRLVDVAEKLKKNTEKFKILVIGNGKDYELLYKKIIDRKLGDYIQLLGVKKNPYPYFKLADALLLVSENEGYPVVFNEAKLLELPIITTNVSDSIKTIKDIYGYVCEQNVDDIVEKMKLFLEKGFIIKEKFNSKKYNEEIIGKIVEIIED